MGDVVVLDASAMLALLLNEPGGDVVAGHLDRSVIGAANFAEILTKLAERGGDVEDWSRRLRSLVAVELVSARHAEIAADLVRVTRSAGLSLGDRLCLALAIDRDAAALTCDRLWRTVPHGANVRVLR